MKHPTYKITTVTGFMKVPQDRRETCLKEFAAWLAVGDVLTQVAGSIPIKLPECFEWIDDDLHTMQVSVSAGGEKFVLLSGRVKGFGE